MRSCARIEVPVRDRTVTVPRQPRSGYRTWAVSVPPVMASSTWYVRPSFCWYVPAQVPLVSVGKTLATGPVVAGVAVPGVVATECAHGRVTARMPPAASTRTATASATSRPTGTRRRAGPGPAGRGDRGGGAGAGAGPGTARPAGA